MHYIQSEENKTYIQLKKSCKSKENFFFEGERLVEDVLLRSKVDIKKILLIFKKSYLQKNQGLFNLLECSFKTEPVFLKEKGKVLFELEKIFEKNALKDSIARLLDSAICLEDKLFDKLSETVKTQGVAVLHFGDFSSLKKKLLGEKSIVLEQLQDPGNLGSILRCASAFGYQNIIFIGDCVRLQNPKVIRSSMGALFKLNYFYFSSFKEAKTFFEQEQITLVAGSLKGQDLDPWIKNFSLPLKHLALLVGNEARGISSEAEQNCQHFVKIEMEDNVESLNVSNACAILAYHLKQLFSKK